MRNIDAVRASACAMAKPCVCEDNGKGARARGHKDAADNARIDNCKATRDHKHDHMAASLHKGDVKAARVHEGDSEAVCVSVHVMIRLPAHTKD